MYLWRDTDEGDKPGEEWRDTEYELFQVSSLGRVRVKYFQKNANGRHFWPGRIITQSFSSEDRQYLRASLNGKPRSTHRLVAKAFVSGETSERTDVNHKDLIKTNNHYKNLEWVTPQENIDHAVALGARNYRMPGEANPAAKLKEAVITAILDDRYVNQMLIKDLGIKYNIHPQYAQLIVKGKRWHEVYTEYMKYKTEKELVNAMARTRRGTM